jgi:hypothetical protein
MGHASVHFVCGAPRFRSLQAARKKLSPCSCGSAPSHVVLHTYVSNTEDAALNHPHLYFLVVQHGPNRPTIPNEIDRRAKMRRGADPPAPKKYKAALVSPEVRDFMGRVGLELQARDWAAADVVDLFAHAGAEVSVPTLQRYYRAIRQGTTPLSTEKASGRRTRLTPHEKSILAGLFLVREDNGEKSTLKTYTVAAQRFFQVTLGDSVAQRYLDDFKLSSKLMGARSGKDSRTKNDLIAEALADLQRFHSSGFLSVHPSKLWSIDVVTDTMRRERTKSYGRKNGSQRKFISKPPKYTTSIISMVNAEGYQIHPGIFTYNPDLDPTGRNGAAVMKKCKKLNLDSEYIWYVKSNKAYHKESTDCYYSYLSEFESWKGHRVLSDRGTSFRVDGEDLFESLGFDWHETFTPSVHGPLSINDGHLHPVAKAAWRQMRDDNSPDWKRTLLLVDELYHIPEHQTARKWVEHMMRGQKPTAKGVEKLLFKKETAGNANTKLWNDCIAQFWEFEGKTDVGDLL